ncbi:MAG: ACP S-malonyltransferase, partial [Phycisphaerales bacterium]|nr:ACP S-malonyltransferase [Phycisphaerales bacterium]
SSPAAAAVFDEAESILGDRLGAPLRTLCAEGPADRLNQTDVAQPALYVAGVACYRALEAEHPGLTMRAAAGLSLGEYTALHLAGAFSFADGLELVALRGRLMQDAATASAGGMVALIGADDQQADDVCAAVEAAMDDDIVIVPANYNAPGQIVLSGHTTACEKAAEIAATMDLRATVLAVAGAFHSPLMQPAADGLSEALASATFGSLSVPVWSNVTARPHDSTDMELLKRLLVEQLMAPVRWAQSCASMIEHFGRADDGATMEWHEVAPGSVLRGLMRRIDRNTKVMSHDTP